MIHEPSALAIAIFAVFVAFTLGISFWFARRGSSAGGYFAAGGNIHWFVNGVAFAGDYLSAASFLGICGMIAFYGYDGFLYSIGYLAGWVVALFVIAEPLRRMGKYTFADALAGRFGGRSIRLAAAVSTLAVSTFYLIPQMVGAGVLVQPLLGLPHWAGVVLVGTVVIIIVTTAGMVSTTYVQFLKGALLVGFSTVLVGMVLSRGLMHRTVESSPPGRLLMEADGRTEYGDFTEPKLPMTRLTPTGGWKGRPYERWKHDKSGAVATFELVETPARPEAIPWYENVRRDAEGRVYFYGRPHHSYRVDPVSGNTFKVTRYRTDVIHTTADGRRTINGLPQGTGKGETDIHPVGDAIEPSGGTHTGALGPVAFLAAVQDSVIARWVGETIVEEDKTKSLVYHPVPTKGADILMPGGSPTFSALRKDSIPDKLNFISLMLALFCGTASLPHILIRYYTVADSAAARKSTVVGIGTIGLFYVLTLFMGLGAMVSGALDPTNSNMSAPLLARSFGEWLFACISAIAFTTVLGTVAGLIVAASGAVAHDLMEGVLGRRMSDEVKVRAGKTAAMAVGVAAVVLGILFAKMNVNYLVGWAFSVAASANLPALVMLLFWRRTSPAGISAGIWVGMTSSLAWILLSGDTFKDVYGLDPASSPVPFSQPGIVTIPLAFAVTVVASLLWPAKPSAEPEQPDDGPTAPTAVPR